MDAQQDWRTSLRASERYDNIQNIQRALASNPELAVGKTPFVIEDEVYRSSASRDEYDAACDISQSLQSRVLEPTVISPPSPPFMNSHGTDVHVDVEEASGERIGPYRNCQYIASGVTAEVYRCGDRALKVVTETHNIAPHDPFREAKILAQLKRPCIPLLETFRDHEQRFTLVFPYMPLTLSGLLDSGPLESAQIRTIFTDLFEALKNIHSQGIIHRDIKPQAILLEAPHGPAYLSDFGTAWHPELSLHTESAHDKILDIGTGPYRAPEVLFGNKSYGTAVDMWGAGCMLAECARRPPRTLFESRAVHEDGNQLGLILSIFKTIGTPTRETWPEAQSFKTPPFDFYQVFQGQPWNVILGGVDEGWADIVKKMVRYDSTRMTAAKVSRLLFWSNTSL
ncbi:kinase-like protein [Cryphonectria parasitica EP155]|uniref:cyclin-dependent kinase n=1 Tax=Cryphonectria parasitica (strain ATCC 38755 / EP155) TaxID=660469 RepID=A0A9P4Y6G1_CRYP1|nr:kinase-like protein [Cryphonectria parasitica EP155]KAF3766980.1 kinase-like protein [Cryphonectria parasitica EP155]